MRLIGSLCVAVLLAPAAARAADSWSTPYPGVRYLFRTTSTPWRIHALVVNLCAAGISVRTTASSERRRTVPSFGAAVGAEAAINGDFFSFSTYSTAGLSMHAGTAWSGTADSTSSAFLGFGDEHAVVDPPSHKLAAAPSWLKEAVSGHPNIVIGGTPKTSWAGNSLCSVRHPRTAAGLSEDRRTLYLAVVDGRWSASVGMTCGELAKLMHGLGAHDAVNLDGGGSSTMWLRSKGVVNHPSDGTPRVVANHLAIQAASSGAAPHCDPTFDELTLQGDGAIWDSATDIDGDGHADLCARTGKDLRCHLAAADSFGPAILGPALYNDSGWNDPANYATIRMGDVNGDGKADLCARANAGIRCWPSTGAGFGAAISGPALSNAAGWAAPRFYSSIRLADANGDGKADVCARSSADFRCFPSTGTGFGAALVGPKLADSAGWDDPSNHATLRMGDVNGDGKADVCARGNAGMSCWLSDGKGFPTAVAGPKWSDASGWGDVRYWSTIRLVDVNGDGKADLCARGASGFRCHLSKGTSFSAAKAEAALSDASGWWRYRHYATIRVADIDGDGDRDLCARSGKGMACWPWEAQGFGASFAGPPWSDAAGWGDAAYHRTIRLADLDGDGKADLCGRGSAGVVCFLASGTGFPKQIAGPAWSDASGWKSPAYYATLRLSGVACTPQAEVCDGKDNDCDGAVDEELDCTTADLGPDEPLDGGGPSELGAAADGGAELDEENGFPDGAGGWSFQDGGPGGTEGSGCDCRSGGGPRSAVWLLLFSLGLLVAVIRWARARRARRALRREDA